MLKITISLNLKKLQKKLIKMSGKVYQTLIKVILKIIYMKSLKLIKDAFPAQRNLLFNASALQSMPCQKIRAAFLRGFF